MRRLRRSVVIVPANVAAFLEKSRAAEADVLMFDLQDAIAQRDDAKAEARQMLAGALAGGAFRARERCVRINSPGSPWIAEDVAMVAATGVESITLSRARSVEDVAAVDAMLRDAAPGRTIEIVLEVDTPGMLADLDRLARSETAVTALQVASHDYALEMGARLFGPHRTVSEDFLAYLRSRVLSVARWQGWNACDLVGPDARDPEAAARAMHASRGLGFDGVLLVFPRLVPLANEVFGVSAEELAWARALVEGWRGQDGGDDWNKGFRHVDGEMVFYPAYEYACRVLFLHSVIAGDPAAEERFRRQGLMSDDQYADVDSASRNPTS